MRSSWRPTAQPTCGMKRRTASACLGLHAAHLVDDLARLLRRDAGVLGDCTNFDISHLPTVRTVFFSLRTWPRKKRVGANSPSLWPTMFSAM